MGHHKIVIRPVEPGNQFETAVRCQLEGNAEEARRIYARVLETDPRHFGALNNLGVLAFTLRDPKAARPLLERACQDPAAGAVTHAALAATLLLIGDLESATREFTAARKLDPNSAEVLHLFAIALQERGAQRDVIACLELAVRLDPNHFQARNNLGLAYLESCRLEEARTCFEEVSKDPANAVMGLANLALALGRQGRWEEGAASLREAVGRSPENPILWSNLAAFLEQTNRLAEARTCAERAVATGAKSAEAFIALGNAYCRVGRHGEASKAWDCAARFEPPAREFAQNLLFMRHYTPGVSPSDMAADHRRWAARFAPSPAVPRHHTNTADPSRRLRIGYVSGDLRAHPVGYFLAPLLGAHDPHQVEIFCYATGPADEWTARMRPHTTVWRNAAVLDDTGLDHMIEGDAIDILIDLSGHTPGNRLGVFARKPAPVQATWLGYFNTTGIDAVDYLIADAQLAPPEETAPFAEQVVRIPGCYLPYRIPEEAPDVSPAPCTVRGFTTYGCFNKLAKVGIDVVEAWAEILRRNPASRLVMRNRAFGEEACREIYFRYFDRFGVARNRIDLLGSGTRREWFAAWNQVDIALDTFPYSGVTTTCDALSMGVPVVTLRGDRFAGRMGATVLHNVGLGDLAARNLKAYIETAVELGQDAAQIVELRATMRPRLSGSALCDTPGFARKLEAAYREMWIRWCGSSEPRR